MRSFADFTKGLPRMVRDLSRKLEKMVRIEISAKEIKVDRDILQKLESPVNHILRNAVDHGIESPAERRKRNKPIEGRIHLSAIKRDGLLTISISDDGRGVSFQAIRDKAVVQGLVTMEKAKDLSEKDLFDFLFRPGFSTAGKISEVSGRGVGLDAVKVAINEIGGTVWASSSPGQSMKFHLQLPLSRTSVRVMLAKIGGETYAFPLTNIHYCSPFEEQPNHSGQIKYGGRTLPVHDGRRVLGTKNELSSPAQPLNLLVIGDGEMFTGLLVGQLEGHHDVWFRPIKTPMGPQALANTAAVMENGKVIPVVDIAFFLNAKQEKRPLQSKAPTREKQGSRDRAPHSSDLLKKVLVVDDSLIVRELQRSILSAAGFSVSLACDGQEGWDTLSRESFDLVITDVDMPKLGGHELTALIRSTPKFANIPILMVSNRESENDRQMGFDAGANHYLKKSDLDRNHLLNALDKLL